MNCPKCGLPCKPATINVKLMGKQLLWRCPTTDRLYVDRTGWFGITTDRR